MKRLPFNACDYRCERCLETAECAVFQKLQERSLQNWTGGDGNDSAAVLRDIRESFRETEARIKQKARDIGIDLDGIAGESSAEETRADQTEGAGHRDRSRRDRRRVIC